MKVTLKPQGSAQFLATLPALTGFIAHESLVAVFFSGKRSIGSFRLDLPADDDLVTTREFANLVVDTLCRVPGCTGAVPVIYCDRAVGGNTRLPYSLLWSLLEDCLADSEIEVLDACCVASDGWGSYLDADLPVGGRDLEEIDQNPMRLDAMMAVDREIVDLDAMSELPSSDERLSAETSKALADRLDALPTSLRLHEVLQALDLDLDDLVRRISLGIPPPGPDHVGSVDRLLDFCTVAHLDIVREIFLVGLAFGPEALSLAAQESQHTRVRHTQLASVAYRVENTLTELVLRGIPAAPPDRERMRSAVQVLQRCCAAADPTVRADLTAMIAWLWWAIGISSVAERLLAQVLEHDPDHGLAGVFADLCLGYAAPAWFVEPNPDAESIA
ncbi:DUF4192 family protein [Pseudoclavibacter sp. 13-3]|uniref:DUF4192 family protein n=1 Tax=Pseudoclavibacter sp. 13-3 TaxID=2901228 RepID=UPI001E5BADF9|nr:DUF4192 family protein [Pseudoclavibacter sp. 13-3]MCD7100865.1 DUF4192 domain-containing protein [Pseudoclavibacter sp. 13-3]